jgi:hypothetical protein
MAGFQFTPVGIIPLGAPAPDLGDNVAGATVHVPMPEGVASPDASATPLRAMPSAPAAAPDALFDPGKPLTGKELAKAAKARIKVLDRMLRTVPALEEERASLKRLLAAAAPAARKKPDGKLQ